MADLTRNLILLSALLAAAGCSAVLRSPHDAAIKNTMAQAEYFAGRGDYEQAISKYEQTIKSSSRNPWRDKVLFELGCLYAVNENPGQDFAQSLLYFRRLNEEFPKSRFKAQIQVWVGFLETLVSLELELEARKAEFAENKSALEKEIARLKAERLELESSWSKEISLKANKLRELENLIEAQKTAIETLQQQLKKMKEIDIQSEKKATEIK